jgi:hypothetical protein
MQQKSRRLDFWLRTKCLSKGNNAVNGELTSAFFVIKMMLWKGLISLLNVLKKTKK